MNRRTFLGDSPTAMFLLAFRRQFLRRLPVPKQLRNYEQPNHDSASPPAEEVLPGTAPLTLQGDLPAQMVDGIHRFLLKRTADAVKERANLWERDYSSAEAYEHSITGNRERFRHIIGATDQRVPAESPEPVRGIFDPPEAAKGKGYKVYAVRWAVLEPVVADFGGLDAEGLLLHPERRPVARVVAIPDADWTPEMMVGMAPGVPPEAQFARRLAESGCQVIIPLLIDRADEFSGIVEIDYAKEPRIRGIDYSNAPHREWIYRMAFEVGRHTIGFEVQKVLAAVDWFEGENQKEPAPIGVMGYGEGGLLALYSGALDRRIKATAVSGYFQEREGLWKEPIYRDVWGLVREFGDAELAGLIAPRSLVVEACRGPEVAGPPAVTAGRENGACPNGTLVTPPLESVHKEVERARSFYAGLKAEAELRLVVSGQGKGQPGSEKALGAFLRALGSRGELGPAGTPPRDLRTNHDPQVRFKRQFDHMVSFTQALVRKSPDRRKEFWAKANSAWPTEKELVEGHTYMSYMQPSRALVAQWASSPEQWKEATKWYRDYIWEEVIGRLPQPSVPANPRTRLVYDEPTFKGYEVVLDVWPDVFAYGILLVPKGIVEGERRPVVVCQHGLESRVQELTDPKVHEAGLRSFGDRLVQEGFVVYAPQNPYIGDDRFRIIQRMGHPLKLALFSFIIGQHDRTLEWLAEQPFVDPDRIGFYGISYGGKTAVRVPPFLDRYALSICSADFNDWVWKTTNVGTDFSYLSSGEYDMYEFNLANIANYAELANLVAPRPFMVERGHYDMVSPDQTVASEYAKVRWFYAYMGIPEKTRIEFFSGPHMIYGRGTFEFLREHLHWKPGRWSPVSD
ncbi:putative secreted protein [Acidobacteriia bacterium SbA2]|nr:putative secreted protein [Acidobacteriia bacterium SbA2]